MFNEIVTLLKGNELKAAMNALVGCTQLIEMFNADMIKDSNARNAIIDVIIEMLEKHKE